MIPAIERLPAWWERFWFAPGSALTLAVARVVFAVHGLWMVLSRDFAGMAAAPAELWTAVTPGISWRYLIFPGHPEIEHFIQLAVVAALIAAAVGWRARVTCLAAAILLYHFAPYENVFWAPTPYFRGLELTILGLLVLAFTPCADALAPRSSSARAAWEYRWGVVLLQILVAVGYLYAGYAKLFREGLAWMSSGNMRAYLLAFTQDERIAVFTQPGSWLADQPALCTLMGVGTVLFELTFIVAVVSARARRFFIPAAVAFHLGILLTLNIYWLYWPLLAVFVDWEAVLARVRRRRVLSRTSG